MRWRATAFALASIAALATAAPAQAVDMEGLKSKGFIQCGISGILPGFSTPDDKGNFSGIDVDYCRALAAAVFGDATKVKFTPLSAKERFTALQSGEIDVLSRNTTWTYSRDTGQGINFVGVIYYDGQGIMVNKSLGVSSAEELDGATICVNQGTTSELNLADFFRTKGLAFTPVTYENMNEVVAAYAKGRCDAYTADRSQLAAQRTKLEDPSQHVILPDVLSKEPLGPVVRQGDDEWFNVAKWTLFTLVNAEELGITSANADELKTSSTNPNVQRLLGTEGALGEKLGLADDFGYQIVKQVGNYGEVFDRNLGPDTPIGLERGENALWTNKGLHYAPPLR